MAKKSGKKKTILAVDGEHESILTIKQALQKNGWAVKEFTNPILALKHFRQHSAAYDAVLTDVRMPGMNGFDFVRKVKSIRPDVKIFLMTTMEISRLELEKLLPSVKVDGLIEKSVSTGTLVSLIEKGSTTMKRSYHGFEVDSDEFVCLEYG
jgi:response regulator RpfG family c-di-GMP phosphodiesterase